MSGILFSATQISNEVEGKEINAFTLRMAFGVTVWNDHRIAIANDIAAILRQRLTGATPLGLNNN